ncbi:MAG: DUF4332 domain-containing protein [Caulobacterales bacterium]|nr:DUF4332 domain-containing protein [Caulobacterales bacterium]
MSLLFKVIVAHKCPSTHHRVAMDALGLLRAPDAAGWTDLFLARHTAYLNGAKAPDTTFKDFVNHVLHVAENDWGGAADSAEEWYERLVDALVEEDWREAVFSAGVLSHYVADPCQPLHTGQTEDEGPIHRAFEWSVAKSYNLCRARLPELGGYPEIAIDDGTGGVARMVRESACLAHESYELILDHFDLLAAKSRPQDGLDAALRDAMAVLLGRATACVAAVLDRAIDEAGVAPPASELTLAGYLAALEVPLRWVLRRIEDADEASAIRAMYEELRRTGKVVHELPEDDREVRRWHAVEVTKTPLRDLDARPIRALGAKHGAPAPRPVATAPRSDDGARSAPAQPRVAKTSRPRRRFHLEFDSPVVDAPSIGPKTAARLEAAGVYTVRDLLEMDAQEVADALDVRHITPRALREWGDQARLVLEVPNLRGHDAQILTACGVRGATYLARIDADALFASVEPFCATSAGRRIIRSGKAPTRQEIRRWIASAQEARSLEAA